MTTIGLARIVAVTDKRIIVAKQALFGKTRVKSIDTTFPRGTPITLTGDRFGVNRTLKIEGAAAISTDKWSCAELIRLNEET